jgi:hypothetical protein
MKKASEKGSSRDASINEERKHCENEKERKKEEERKKGKYEEHAKERAGGVKENESEEECQKEYWQCRIGENIVGQ